MANPAIYAAIQRYKAALAAKETQASRRLVNAYGQMYQNLVAKIGDLEADIAALGDDPTPAQVVRLDRYKSLLAQTADEMDKFAGTLEGEVRTLRQIAIDDAATHSRQLVLMSLPRLPAATLAQLMVAFNRMPASAVEAMLGSLSKGSPLAKLLDKFGIQAAQDIGATITDGIALGYNPRKVATQIREKMGGNLTRALTVSRTEMLRSYRAATLGNYAANPDIVKGWIWSAAKSPRSCLACLALDGREFPMSEEFQKSHVQCRCSPRPKTISYADLGLKTKEPPSQYQTAAQWFEGLSDAEKRGMMSGAAFDAYKAGRVTLQDFIGTSRSKQWGDSFTERPISDILGG